MIYSDQNLREFLEGKLSAQKTREIETAMLSDTDLEMRIMSLDSYADPVRALMQNIPGQGRIDRLAQEMSVETRQVYPKLGWQALAACLAFGLFAGWAGNAFFRTDTDNWRMEVAHYQALYVAQTIAHLDNDPANIRNQFKRASSAVDLALPQQALGQVSGLKLARAQVLGFQGAPLIQIVYQATDGAPIALCIIAKRDRSMDDGTAISMMQGLASAAWETESHQFLLIGDAHQRDIKDWAKTIKDVFPS